MALRLLFLVFTCWIGCSGHKGDFVPVLTNEIGGLGGRTNGISNPSQVVGRWRITRDNHGAAIDVVGIDYIQLKTLLSKAYGEPQFYSRGNERHGTTFLFPATNAGIAIFLSSTHRGAEITLLKAK